MRAVEDSLASVLIVNYNGAKHLPACLTALEQQSLPRYRFEVILVDNASQDDSVRILREQFPWVRLIALDYNSGFAEGNNIAARYAHGSLLVLLNNDTIPDPYWLEELIAGFQQNPDESRASKLVFAHDPRVLNSSGIFLLRDGRGADRGFRELDKGRYEADELIFAGCGAALAVSKNLHAEQIFDPHYFMYYEDLNLGWLDQLRDHATIYCPRSLVRHVHGAAAGDASPLFHYHVERNRALTCLRNADPFLAIFTAIVLFAKALLLIVKASSAKTRQRTHWLTARAVLAAVGSYLVHFPRVVCERHLVRSEIPHRSERCR